ncbi:MAG: hypothetical protein NNA22_07135 [Nitrospira sp.]|nr:hypothetical protein [Nitrospira sp.]
MASQEDGTPTIEHRGSAGGAKTGMIAIGLGVVVAVAVGVGMAPRLMDFVRGPSSSARTVSSSISSSQPAPSPPVKPETPVTTESIETLLADLDQAVKRKDVEGVLRHIAPDAVILIHMKQGAHHQTALLSREEYRKALAAEFAFLSADNSARVNTKVSLAPDERSAKISFKTTETLRQAEREFTVEGEHTLLVTMRGGKPTIVSLERDVPGDST